MMMHPIRPIHHSLQTDAGASVGDVVENYPVLIQTDVPGYYYQLATLDIVPCVASDRWQTVSQWEAVRGQPLDGLGTA